MFAAVITLAVGFPALAGAAQITIAAAADLTFAFREMAPRFEKASGNTVKLSLDHRETSTPRSAMAPLTTCSFQPT